jgi:ribosomal protein S18 acetylase RimI-like enzyme
MVAIRPMTEADHAEVSELLCACFRWLAEREGFTAQQLEFLLGRGSERTVREESKTRPHLVACEGQSIVGLVVVHGNEIARLYVHPRSHRRGVGRALFETAEGLIRSAGHAEARVGALVEGAAAFYKAMGMKPVSCEPYEPAIFLGREVVVLRKSF